MGYTFKKTALLFLILAAFSIPAFGQTSKFNVEYSTKEGSLTKKDFVKKEFGRYDGYQLPLNKGEYAYFVIFSNDFSPNLVLMDPNGEVYQRSSSKGDQYVSVGINAPVGGEWLLYVIGDSTALGDYSLQLGFTDSASLSINKKADFCTGLDYLTAHANAYFVFLQSLPTEEPLYQLEGSVDAIINGDDASYTTSFYQGNNSAEAAKIYESLLAKIKACPALTGWTFQSTDWQHTSSGKEMTAVWRGKKSGSHRLVQVSFCDLSEATDADYPEDYTIELVIKKSN